MKPLRGTPSGRAFLLKGVYQRERFLALGSGTARRGGGDKILTLSCLAFPTCAPVCWEHGVLKFDVFWKNFNFENFEKSFEKILNFGLQIIECLYSFSLNEKKVI